MDTGNAGKKNSIRLTALQNLTKVGMVGGFFLAVRAAVSGFQRTQMGRRTASREGGVVEGNGDVTGHHGVYGGEAAAGGI